MMESSSTDVRKVCFLLNVCGFMDLFGVGMILPLLSTRIRELGGSPTLTGLVGSVYGGIQLISSPLMGKVSDSIGRYPSLLMSVVVSAVGYCIVGMASSILLFAFGRFILGWFKHNQSICKAYLYDILPEKEASAAIGRFHSFSSFGFILGPIIGGHVADGDGGFPLAAFFASSVFFITAGLIWLTVPNDRSNPSVPKRSPNGTADIAACSQSSRSDQPEDKDGSYVRKVLTTVKQAFSMRSLKLSSWIESWDLLLVRFLAGLAVIMFRTNFVLNLREKHEVSKLTIGYITSYTAAVAAFFGFTVGYITKRYKHDEAKLFLHTLLLQTATLACLCLAPSVSVIVLFLTPLSFGTSIGRVSSTSILVNISGKERVAAILGWNQSINSISRMVAPAVVGVIQEWSMDGATYVSVVAMALAAVLMVLFPEDPELRKGKQKDE